MIFCVVYLIKGGAGIFNLYEISEFIYVVEIYFDLICN